MKQANREASITPEGWLLGAEDENSDDGIRVVDVQDVTVATVWKQPHDPEEWATANARLIAAAPDLLEAAKTALFWAEAQGYGNGSYGVRQLRRAITKAEGRDDTPDEVDRGALPGEPGYGGPSD